MVEPAVRIWADGPPSNPLHPAKPLIREWATFLEKMAGIATGPLVIGANGQSNMLAAFAATGGDATINERCFVWRPDLGDWAVMELGKLPFRTETPVRNNLAFHYCKALQEFTGQDVYLIFYAVGGTSIMSWLDPSAPHGLGTGENFAVWKEYFDDAMASPEMLSLGKSSVDVQLFHQGENQHLMDPDEYTTYIEAWNQQYRVMPYGGPDIPLIAGELAVNGATSGQLGTWRSYARSMKDARFALASASGLTTLDDNIHFTGTSLVTLGDRYFDTWRMLAAANVAYSVNGMNLGDINAIGTLRYAPTKSIASATTTDIGTVASNNVLVTGTATIESLGISPIGTVKWLLAGSPGLTFKHNSSTLIMPGGKDLVCLDNDWLAFLSGGSGWRCISYSPYSRMFRSVATEDVAVAGVNVDISLARSNFIRLTGGGSVETLTADYAGTPIFVSVSADTTFVHSSLLVLPNAQNLVLHANDWMMLRSGGSGWRYVMGGRIGGGPVGVLKGSATVNHPDVPANGRIGPFTITVTGAAVGDNCVVNVSDDIGSGLILSNVRVSAADTVEYYITNPTTTNFNPTNRTFSAMVFKA